LLLITTVVILFLILGERVKSFVREFSENGQSKSSISAKAKPIPTSTVSSIISSGSANKLFENKTSEQDRLCNELIMKSWSDKSIDTLKAKKEACAHNKNSDK
jgi:hypothetical protein